MMIDVYCRFNPFHFWLALSLGPPLSPSLCPSWHGKEFTRGEDGFFRNKKGKVLTASAIEQRLRRFCAIKKNGTCKAGDEIRRMFNEERAQLTDLFKECNLSKAPTTDHVK